ncbi:MAG: hypothetical protein EBR99_06595, partial [Actinobacteria bacterium]|nr:hypothetical protein [Actinomycetota bacterium]
VAWARRLLEEFNAAPIWPSIYAVDYDEFDASEYHGVYCPEYHEGYRETVLMTAVHRGDVAMIQLLIAHFRHSYSSDIEHINMECIWKNYHGEAGVDKSELLALCLNRRANAFSLAIGKAQVPDSHLLIDGDKVVDVLEPYRSDPVLAALRDVDYWDLPTCHVAAARYLTKNVHDIMPTHEEIMDDVADLSAEKRALYFSQKKAFLEGGAAEEDAKRLAKEAVERDPEYEEDSTFGTNDSLNTIETGNGEDDEVGDAVSTDGDMSVEYEEDLVCEFDEQGCAVIMFVEDPDEVDDDSDEVEDPEEVDQWRK